MALVKFDRGLYRNGNVAKGLNYGQIEENQTWFNRAGMVEAQCALDPDCFSAVQVSPFTKYDATTDPTNPVKIVAQDGAFLQGHMWIRLSLQDFLRAITQWMRLPDLLSESLLLML